ncbi:MAG: hypothetical protein IGR92_04870, partial [Leptolyngbyaceae cyanobacterium T60_A2020_046]|nr:hypothetical protein [Leptolyngbyaceae cyanobacterium T60_A2020_046]
MLALIRHLLRTQAAVVTRSRSFGTTVGLICCAAIGLWGRPANAQSTLPSFPGLKFQTSSPRRCAGIGDWYTTQCGGTTVGAPGYHTFFINITEADLAANGGSIVITIENAPSGLALDETNGPPDPTRFSLFAPGGTLLQSQTFLGPNNPSNDFSFLPITAPGVYEVRSESGALLINGDNATNLNNDDNSFLISVPINDFLIGQFQGSFQQDTGSSINFDLFFLVGPGTDELFLRNFDLDNRGTVVYEDPLGAGTTGTSSGNAVWNGGGNLNMGGDTVPLTQPINQAGRWRLGISDYSSNNQTIFEANTRQPDSTIPLFDSPPQRAGNFVITPDTTRTTAVGAEVCHPFTVTNNFFTTDIINLNLTGTDPLYTVELRDGAGNPLVDTDGDGIIDTGILQPGKTASFQLCVTPQAGAPPQDVTTIEATSFMDTTVRAQAGQPAPTPQSVVKTTLIGDAPQIGLAKEISAPRSVAGSPGFFDFDITYVVTNTGSVPLSSVQVTDDLQDVLIDNPTTNGADGFTIQGVTVTSFTGTGTAPTANGAYNGDTDQNLFSAAPNQFDGGASATVTVTVRVDLSSDGLLDTQNSATAMGDDSNGTTVTDVSQNGSDVDPDGDGDPTNNNAPSPWQVGGAPQIGLAKEISAPTAVVGQPGFFDFDITYVVTNTGSVPLSSVQVTDDLQDVLIDNPTTNGADGFTIQGVTVTSFTGTGTAPTANGAYNGDTDQNLFSAAPNQFDGGASATVTVTVRVDLSSDGLLDTQNSATAMGDDSNGTTVTDVSQNGSDVDPDGDGDPTNNNAPSPWQVGGAPQIGLAKEISAPTAVVGQPGFFDFDITYVV